MVKNKILTAVFGFLITFALFIDLMSFGIIGSARLSVFKGKDLADVLNNIDFYSLAHNIAVEEVQKELSDYGITEEILGDISDILHIIIPKL